MIITPHVLVGMSVAKEVNISVWAFFLGFLSHFLLDALPHLDQGTFSKKGQKWPSWVYYYIVLDGVVALALFTVIVVLKENFWLFFWGGFGGALTDLIDNNPPLWFLRKYPFFKQLHLIHEKIHFDLSPRYWYWGIPFELLIIGGSIWYLLKF